MFTPRNSPQIVAPTLSTFAVRFCDSQWETIAASTLSRLLPIELHTAGLKRKVECIAGRFCATHAIRALNGAFSGPIERWPDRSPRWPAGIVGSITHTDGWAWAAVAASTRLRAIGIDSERIVVADTAASIVRTIAAPGERAPADNADDGLAIYCTALFSAKESVYKCLSPLVQRMFGFEHVCVEVDSLRRRFCATLLIDLDAEFRAGTRLWGRWEISKGCVHTAVILPNEVGTS